MTEIQTDVLIVGASLAGAAAAKRTVDAGFHTVNHRAQGAAAPQDLFGHPLAARLPVPAGEFRRAARQRLPHTEVGDRRELPVSQRPAVADAFIPGPSAAHLPQVRRPSRREGEPRRRARAHGVSQHPAGCERCGGEDAAHRRRCRRPGDRVSCEVRHCRRRSALRSRRQALSGVPRSIYWFVVGQKYYKADLGSRPAVVPLHDQLAGSVTTPGATPRTAATSSATPTSTASRGRRAMRVWSITSSGITVCAIARRCPRKAASRTSACR